MEENNRSEKPQDGNGHSDPNVRSHESDTPVQPSTPAETPDTHDPSVSPEFLAEELHKNKSETPSPQVETPSPQGETPSPQVETPSPQVETPSPQVETPSPQVETPSPTG